MDLSEVKVQTEPGLDFSELAPHIRAVATGKLWTPRPRDIKHQYGGVHGPGAEGGSARKLFLQFK